MKVKFNIQEPIFLIVGQERFTGLVDEKVVDWMVSLRSFNCLVSLQLRVFKSIVTTREMNLYRQVVGMERVQSLYTEHGGRYNMRIRNHFSQVVIDAAILGYRRHL